MHGGTVAVRGRMMRGEHDLVEQERGMRQTGAAFLEMQTGELDCALGNRGGQLLPAVHRRGGQGSGQLIAFGVGKDRRQRAVGVLRTRPQGQIFHVRDIRRGSGQSEAVRAFTVPQRLERAGSACDRGIVGDARERNAFRGGEAAETVLERRDERGILRITHADVHRNGRARVSIGAGERAVRHRAARGEHALFIDRADAVRYRPGKGGVGRGHFLTEVVAERIEIDRLARLDADRGD